MATGNPAGGSAATEPGPQIDDGPMGMDMDAQGRRDLAAGRRVLEIESAALAGLAMALDRHFAEAVALLAGRDDVHRPGRVIVTGMGKSGHVGRKIAATFASTGTPAQFVHPGEASHGDLGMITAQDLVLALSNSGETRELSDILHYVKRYGIALIGITAAADSTLARLADPALILPHHAEAADIGLAPTTSTSLTMALGDALAVALLERKGFSPGDFHRFHPGGRLGGQLALTGSLMHGGAELPLVTATTRMDQAILTMTSKHFGCVGVCDGAGCLTGIITDGDLRRHMAPDLTERVAEEIMTRDPAITTTDVTAGETLALMNRREITALFVVDGHHHPVGIVHIHDFLRAGVA